MKGFETVKTSWGEKFVPENIGEDLEIVSTASKKSVESTLYQHELIKGPNGELITNPDYIVYDALEEEMTLKFAMNDLDNENPFPEFGTPDKKQQDMIKSWDEGFRNKMINHKLKYTENTIEIEIDGERIIFDKEQPIKEKMSWEDSMLAVSTLEGRKGIDRVLMKKLINIFSSKEEVIGLANNCYWSSTTHSTFSSNAWAASFNENYEFYNFKNEISLYSICIHDN